VFRAWARTKVSLSDKAETRRYNYPLFFPSKEDSELKVDVRLRFVASQCPFRGYDPG
jgi:hypothetical protein